MRAQIVLLAFVAFAFASEIVMFKEFMNKYNKVYETESETQQRFAKFQENLKVIDSLNDKNTTARFGITKFADMSVSEFKAKYLSPFDMKEGFDPSWPVAEAFSDEAVNALPTTVDWRTKGAVTPVKNQEQCGSCWAFSAVGNLEGQWFLAGHTLTGLSEQNLVDCDHTCIDGGCDAGCDGGLMPNAWTYIMNNGGIDTESSYPYLGYDSTCDYSASNIGATVKNWTMIAGNETQMAAYCAANGPISIAVDAVAWQFYEFGIFQDPWCGDTLDHGVLIVGYDHEIDWFGEDLAFWWVKNSWGEDWGYDGYIKLAKGDEQCGDNLFPCSSIV